VDPVQKQAMADRFFQVLVCKDHGASSLTQFIGEIPPGKALPHRHLYEETLIVLAGAGMMWTETRKAAVTAGDVIFLPRKQLHSLQCVGDQPMLVAGVIHPGDNPSINYY
jgi:quercetin dioxygenase-like cupin family protein